MTRDDRRALLLDAAAAAAAAAALYLAAFAASGMPGFVNYDDPEVVQGNPVKSWGTLGEAFTGRMAHAWLPLYALSLGLDNILFGPGDAGPWHVHSVLLHALNAGLVVALARALGAGRLPSLLAGLLFGLHPAVTESVAWVASRKDLLSFSFAAASGLAFLRAEEEPRRPRLHAAGALLLGLGMLAKGTVLVVPALLALAVLARATDPAARRRGLLATIPYFAVAAGLAALHYVVAAGEGAAGANLGAADTLPARAAAGLAAAGESIRLLAVPFPLSVDHGIEPGRTPVLAAAAGAGILAACLLGAAALWRRGRRGAAAALLAIPLAIAPFNGLFPRTTVLFAERYLYVAAAAAAGLLGWALTRASARAGLPAAAPLAVAAAFAAVAAGRIPTWRDSLSLWEDAVAKSGGTHVSHAKLGEALAERALEAGDPETARTLFARSCESHRAAAERARSPLEEMRARHDLGLSLLGAGKPAEALAEMERARGLRAGVAVPAGFASGMEVNRAKALEALGREGEAAAALEAAVREDPLSGAAWTNLGVLHMRAGRTDAARAALLVATKVAPDLVAAFLALADLEAITGDAESALRIASKAAEAAPRDPAAAAKAGEIAFLIGQPRIAEEWFRKSLAADPRHRAARRGLAGTLAFRARASLTSGKAEEGERLAREGTEADPSAAEPWFALGDALRARGDGTGALEAYLQGGRRGAAEAAARARAGLYAAMALQERKAGREDGARALLEKALAEGAPEIRPGGKGFAVKEGLERIPPPPAGAQARPLVLGGVLALLAGDADAARAALDRAVASDLADAALVLRSRARILSDDLDGAVEDLETLAARRPGDARARFLLGHTLAARSARRRADGKDAAAAADSARAAALQEEARSLDPSLLEASIALAEQHFTEGRIVDAIRELNRILEVAPDRVEPHLVLGNLMKAQYAEAGEASFREEAEEHFRHVLAIDPSDARALVGLGEVAAFGNRPREALTYALRALAVDAELPAAKSLAALLLVRSGRDHLAKGDADAALEAARRADDLGGETADLCLLRSEAYRRKNDWARAGVEVERARTLQPGNPDVRDSLASHYRDVGYAFLLHGRKDQAREAFRRAVAADPPRTDLTAVRRLLDHGEEATAPDLAPAVSEALDRAFTEARRLYDEGVAAREAGRLEEAEGRFRASLRSFETAPARYGLGVVLAARDDRAGAEDAYRAATIADPEFADAWLALGAVRFRRGDDAGAAEAWERWLERPPASAAEEDVERVRALVAEIRGRRKE